MDIINYETIPLKVKAFVVPDFNEFVDDPVKHNQFLNEVNSFISTTYKYKAEIVILNYKNALYIHCGLDMLYAFPGNIIVKYEDGNVKCYDTISFFKTFRKVTL